MEHFLTKSFSPSKSIILTSCNRVPHGLPLKWTKLTMHSKKISLIGCRHRSKDLLFSGSLGKSDSKSSLGLLTDKSNAAMVRYE